MNRTKQTLAILHNCIDELCKNPNDYLVNPNTNFTRKRKLPLRDVICSTLAMGGKSLTKEMLDYFSLKPDSPTSSAFIQQRAKIKTSAFEYVFRHFNNTTAKQIKTFNGYRLLAIDGSDICIAANPDEPFNYFKCKKDSTPYGLVHLNAMYDILNHTYSDAIIQKRREVNEHKAFVDMVDRYESNGNKTIFIADRGYECYNNMAHVHEAGQFWLIRIKSGSCGILSGFCFPEGEFDITVDVYLSRKQTKHEKELVKMYNNYKFLPSNVTFDYLPANNKKYVSVEPYVLKIRFVRFMLSDGSFEAVATNLDSDEFSPDKLKQLYSMRWGIETSFRELKYAIGLNDMHSKKMEYICQEIFARLIMYNFSELITSTIVIQKRDRKYDYKINFSEAALICRRLFLGKIPPPEAETLIARFLTPIRPDRSFQRKPSRKGAKSFTYRIA